MDTKELIEGIQEIYSEFEKQGYLLHEIGEAILFLKHNFVINCKRKSRMFRVPLKNWELTRHIGIERANKKAKKVKRENKRETKKEEYHFVKNPITGSHIY